MVDCGANTTDTFRFASLFAESLPTEYFERVWDIFLCEGLYFPNSIVNPSRSYALFLFSIQVFPIFSV